MNTSFSFQEGSSESQDSEPPEPSQSNVVEIGIDEGVKGVDASWLSKHTQKALTELALRASTIAVRVVNDDTMSSLHIEHSKIEGTTDVLTFHHSDETEPLSVDIAICLDEAERQASERGHSTNHELLLYIVHGILHCIGFDDYTKAEHEKMHKEEDRILQAIGVGPVWRQSC